MADDNSESRGKPGKQAPGEVRGRFKLWMTEEKHARLRQLAASQGVSMNTLIDELATIALAQFDAETRFRTRAGAGSVEKGLRALAKLDKYFGTAAGK